MISHYHDIADDAAMLRSLLSFPPATPHLYLLMLPMLRVAAEASRHAMYRKARRRRFIFGNAATCRTHGLKEFHSYLSYISPAAEVRSHYDEGMHYRRFNTQKRSGQYPQEIYQILPVCR